MQTEEIKVLKIKGNNIWRVPTVQYKEDSISHYLI